MKDQTSMATIRKNLHSHFGARFSQVEVAKTCNVAPRTLSRWETGGAQPRVDEAIKLARLYGVTVEQLMIGLQ